MSGNPLEQMAPGFEVHIYPVWIENRRQWAVKRVWPNGRETLDLAVYELPATARQRAEHLQKTHAKYHPHLPPAPIHDGSLPPVSERLAALEDTISRLTRISSLQTENNRALSENMKLAAQSLGNLTHLAEIQEQKIAALEAERGRVRAALGAVSKGIDYLADAISEVSDETRSNWGRNSIDNARRQLAEAEKALNPEG